VTVGPEESGSLPETGAGADTGIFLTLEDMAVIFSPLKKNEAQLNLRERQVLNRIERLLYKNLSIEEIENRLRGSVGYG